MDPEAKVQKQLESLTRNEALVCQMNYPFEMQDVFRILGGPERHEFRCGMPVRIVEESLSLWQHIVSVKGCAHLERHRGESGYQFDLDVSAVGVPGRADWITTFAWFGRGAIRQSVRADLKMGSRIVHVRFMEPGPIFSALPPDQIRRAAT